jgi:5'-nucleotidase
MKKLILSLLLLSTAPLYAKQVHIMHTNDLHSYFDGYVDGRGGYARVKKKMDEIREHYNNLGIETLSIDGGDFGEGTSFFVSGGGVYTLKLLGAMGIDAAVIGNHDYMLGGGMLASQIRQADVATKFLSANMITTPAMGLDGLVVPKADFEKNGIKISVIGLSTPEPHFLYPLAADGGGFLPARTTGEAEAIKSKQNGSSLVIALTHLGVDTDKDLAKFSTSIDLIVGGHSHTRLEQPLMVKNKKGKEVPIVQAHAHGLAVGSLLIDVQEDGSVKILSYKLHDIADPLSRDELVQSMVDEAKEIRNLDFDGRFDEVIGFSEIKLAGYENGNAVLKKSCWGEHMAKIAQEAAGATIGLHMASFEGMSFEPGPVTFGNLVDNFPHIRKYGDMGWEVAKFRVKGKIIKTILKAIIQLESQVGVSFYGLTYDALRIPLPKFMDKNGDKKLIIPLNLKINQEKIEKEKFYTIAFPSEIVHAFKVLLPSKVQQLFPGLEYSGKYMWTETEKYVRINSPIKCLDSGITEIN